MRWVRIILCLMAVNIGFAAETWDTPVFLHEGTLGGAASPSISSDNKRLYFVGDTLASEFGGYPKDIFYIEWQDTIWSVPVMLPLEINDSIIFEGSPYISWYDNDTILYFDRGDSIYYSIYTNGGWQNATLMPPGINDSGACDPCLSYDGRKMYFASRRSGNMDIWISERIGGVWQQATKMDSSINSLNREYEPSISANDSILYFEKDSYITPVDTENIWVSKYLSDNWQTAGLIIPGHVDDPGIGIYYTYHAPSVNKAGSRLFVVIYDVNGLTGSCSYLAVCDSGTSGVGGKPDNETINIKNVLLQAYPCPFSNKTLISYRLPKAGMVSISFYNIKGARIKTICSKRQNAGNYYLSWDGRNDNGDKLSTGVYLCKIIYNKMNYHKKLILIKGGN